MQARIAAARGDITGARRSGKKALGLNIAAVLLYVVLVIFVVIAGLVLRLLHIQLLYNATELVPISSAIKTEHIIIGIYVL